MDEAPRASKPELGSQVGRYTLLELLGEGGMGVVYSAVDSELKRHVAIKILRTEKVGRKLALAQKRLLREAQAMALVSHEHLVTIYDVGTFEDHVFLAMEQVQGTTLKAWLEQGQSTARIMSVMMQAGRALQAIHDAGFVHRDFKPDNVIVTVEGNAKVLDLGIARKVALETAEEERIERDHEDGVRDAFRSNLTLDGMLVGTPAFMAPEQISGDIDIGPTADQFAFGVVLYLALAKEAPYPGTKPVELLAHVLKSNRRPWPDDVDVPQALKEAVDRSLEQDPDERFESMNELLEACRRALGLRGELDSLAGTWLEHDRHHDYLLTGDVLREGEALLRAHPDSLSGAEVDFIRASSSAEARQRIKRRTMLAGLGVLGLSMVPTVWILRRRTAALARETDARVRASISTVRDAVEGNFSVAESLTELMVEQRRVWMPHARALLAAGSDALDPQLLEHIARLNDYFRPVVEGTESISSLMVATERSEYLVFEDPEGSDLDPPFRFYNRWVDVDTFDDSAFQVFWHRGRSRTHWLRAGQPDARGRAWTRYAPGARVWFQNAHGRDDIAWTNPYLFYVSRDPGITAARSWLDDDTSFVLGVDFMLMDIVTTRKLRDDGVLAVLMTGDREVVGLPRDPRFASDADARRFFAEHSNAGGVDAQATLPTVDMLEIETLDVAVERASEDDVVDFELDGQTHWAGLSRVGRPEQNLFVLVVTV